MNAKTKTAEVVVQSAQQHQVAERRESLPAAESGAVLSMIERAARDPAVDIDKLERLMAMHERLEARRAEAAFSEAMAAMQADLPVIQRSGWNDSTRSGYAKWEDVADAIMPVLSRHGFALMFRTATESAITATAVLRHRLGHREETTVSLPRDVSGKKSEVHSIGSSLSYAKRYAAFLLLGLSTQDDDDGQGAQKVEAITAAQRDMLRGLLDQASEATQAWFFERAGGDDVSAIPRTSFDKLHAALQAAVRKYQQAQQEAQA